MGFPKNRVSSHFRNFLWYSISGKLLAPQLTGAIREFSLYTTAGCISFSLSLLSTSLFYTTGFSALCALFVLNICKFSRCKIKVVAFATFKNKGGLRSIKTHFSDCISFLWIFTDLRERTLVSAFSQNSCTLWGVKIPLWPCWHASRLKMGG